VPPPPNHPVELVVDLPDVGGKAVGRLGHCLLEAGDLLVEVGGEFGETRAFGLVGEFPRITALP